MNKKFLVILAIITITVVVFAIYFVNYSSESSMVSSDDQLIDSPNDPFGDPPKGISWNCGPEERSKFDVTINSKEDFVEFIKNNEINQRVRLDNFKNLNPEMTYEEIISADVDWDKVLNEVQTETTDTNTIYVLDFNPLSCQGFTLKITADGHVSVYGCCGK